MRVIHGIVTHLWYQYRFKTWVGVRYWNCEMPKRRLRRILNQTCCAVFYFGITAFDCVRSAWATRKVSRLTAWESVLYHARWFRTVLLYHYNSQKYHFKTTHIRGIIRNRYLTDWDEVTRRRNTREEQQVNIAAPSKIYADD